MYCACFSNGSLAHRTIQSYVYHTQHALKTAKERITSSSTPKSTPRKQVKKDET
jgi:hypothetical protein